MHAPAKAEEEAEIGASCGSIRQFLTTLNNLHCALHTGKFGFVSESLLGTTRTCLWVTCLVAFFVLEFFHQHRRCLSVIWNVQAQICDISRAQSQRGVKLAARNEYSENVVSVWSGPSQHECELYVTTLMIWSFCHLRMRYLLIVTPRDFDSSWELVQAVMNSPAKECVPLAALCASINLNV